MSTKLPTEAQLHIAGPDGEYIFVHPETNFSQVIDGTSGKTLTQVLSEISSGTDLQIEKIPFSTIAISNGQTDFEFADPIYDELKSTVTVYLNGEFMHPTEEYTVIKEVGKYPRVVLQTGVKANDRIFIIVERGVIIEETGPVVHPPFSDGYIPTGKRYGVAINKTESDPSNRVQYIGDAAGMTPAKMNLSTGVFDYGSWKDVWFVKNNYPVMLNPDGTEAYKLNPTDYTKKLDGTTSDISSNDGGLNAMSRIPKVFIKQWQDTTHEYILVSDVKHDETWNAFAHTDYNGVIKDNLYISIFKGSLVIDKLRSLSTRVIYTDGTAIQEKAYVQANGPGWDLRSWSHRNLINSLLTIIGKSDNGQAVFGHGHVGTTTNKTTGDSVKRGQFFGSTDQTLNVKVFHIEAWWGDLWDRINGLICNSGKVQVKAVGPYNFTGSGFTDTGVEKTSTDYGYIKGTLSNQYGRFPQILTGGSDSTYLSDHGYISGPGGITVGIVGSPYSGSTTAGPHSISLSDSASGNSRTIAAGLSFI